MPLSPNLQYANIDNVYQLVLSKQADKTLRKLPRNLSRRIKEKLIQIAADPYARHNNVTKLQERLGYRLRIGDWRVIYEIEDEELIVFVLKVGPRGEVYDE